MKRMYSKGEIIEIIKEAFLSDSIKPYVVKHFSLGGDDFTNAAQGELTTAAQATISAILNSYIPIMASYDGKDYMPIWDADKSIILAFGDIAQPNHTYEQSHTTSATTFSYNSGILHIYDDVVTNAQEYLAEYETIEVYLLCVPR